MNCLIEALAARDTSTPSSSRNPWTLSCMGHNSMGVVAQSLSYRIGNLVNPNQPLPPRLHFVPQALCLTRGEGASSPLSSSPGSSNLSVKASNFGSRALSR